MSLSFPVSPSVGQAFQQFVWDGAKWVPRQGNSASGDRVLLASASVSPSNPVATVDFPNVFSSAYDEYEIAWYGAGFSAGAGIAGAFMSAGATVITGANLYTYATMYANSNNSGAGGGGVGNYLFMGYSASVGQQINQDGTARLALPWRTDVIKILTTKGQNYNAGVGVYSFQVSAFLNSNFAGQLTTAIVGFRFLPTAAANFTRGVFCIYGIVKPPVGIQ